MTGFIARFCKTWCKKTALAVGIALGLNSLSTPAHAFLDSEKAWNDLLQFAVRQINAPGEFEIELGKVTKPEEGFALISTLKVRDSDGVWLDARGLLVDWNPTSLLRGRFVFETLSADEINVLRAPIGRGDPPADEAQIAFAWPRPPVTMAIETLLIKRMVIEGGLLPQNIEARIEGRFFDQGDIQEASLGVKRIDRPGDTINLGTRIDFSDTDISFSLEAAEAPGGLVAELSGLPETEALEITAAAAGNPDALPFTIYADIGQIGIADGEGIAKWQNDIAVTFDGQVSPGDQTAARWRNAIGDAARLTLDAQQTLDGGYLLNTFTIDSEAFGFDGKGSVNPEANSIDLDFNWSAQKIDALNAIIAPARLGALNGNATAKGALNAPEIDVDAVIRDLAADFGTVGAVDFRIRSQPQTGDNPDIQRFSFIADTKELAINDSAMQQALGPVPGFSGNGAFYGAENRVALETLKIEAETIDLEGHAEYDMTRGALDAEFTGAAEQLGPFTRLADLPVDGIANLALKIKNLTAESVERLFLNAQLSKLSSDNENYAAITGETATLEALLVESDPGVVAIERGFFESAILRADAKGQFSIPADTVNLNLDWRLKDATRIAQVIAPAKLDGAEGTAELRGTLSEPAIDVNAVASDADYNGYGAKRAALTASMQMRKDLRVPFSMTAKMEGFQAPDETLGILVGDTASIKAAGLYDTATTLVTLSDSAAAIAAGDFTLTGDVHPRKRTLDAAYTLKSRDLTTLGAAADLGISGLIDAEGRATGPFTSPLISTRADIRDLRVYGYSVDAMDLDLATEPAGAEGDVPFVIDMSASNPVTGDAGLDTLIGTNPHVTGSGTFNPQKKRATLKDFSAALNAIRFEADGNVDAVNSTLGLDFDFNANDLNGLGALTGTEISGALAAKGSASGSFFSPAIDITLDGEQLRYGKYSAGSVKASIDMRKSLTGFAPYNIDLTASGLDLGDPALNDLIGGKTKLTANGGFNQSGQILRITNAGITTNFATANADGEIEIAEQLLDVNFAVDAADLSPLKALLKKEVTGKLKAEGTIGGSFSEPAMSSRIKGKALQYDIYSVGVITGSVGYTLRTGAASPLDIDINARGLNLGNKDLNTAIGPDAKIEARGSFDAGRGMLKLHSATAKAGATSLAASGTVNLPKQTMNITYDVDAGDLSTFASLTGADINGVISARGHASGPFVTPSVTTMLSGQALRYKNYSIGSVTGRVEIPASTSGFAPFSADVTASIIRTGDPALDVLIGESAAVQASGRIDQAAQIIEFGDATVSTQTARINAQGRIDAGNKQLDVTFDIEAADISPATALAGKPVGGTLKARGFARGAFITPLVNLDATGTGLFFDQYSTGQLNLSLNTDGTGGSAVPFTLAANAFQPRIGNPQIEALFGETVTLDARGTLSPDTLFLRLNDATARTAAGAVRLAGLVDIQEQTFDAGYSAHIPSLGVLQPLTDQTMAGDVRADGRILGGFENPRTNGVLTGTGIIFRTYEVNSVVAGYDLQNLITGPRGTVSIDGQTPFGPLSANAGFDLTGDAVRVDRLIVNGPGISMGGHFETLPNGFYSGNMDLNATDLGRLGRFAGQDISGAATGRVRFDGAEGRQNAAFDLSVADLRYTQLAAIGTATLKGSVIGALGNDPYIDADLNAASATVSGFAVNRLAVNAIGPLSQMQADIDAAGGETGSDKLKTTGVFNLVNAPRSAQIYTLGAAFKGIQIASASQFIVREIPGGGISASSLNMRIDDGELTGDAEYTPDGLVAKLRVRNVPMKLSQLSGFDLIQSGRLFGDVDIDTRGAPRGSFMFNANVIRLKGAQLNDPFDFTASGTLDGQSADMIAQISSGIINQPFRAVASIPLKQIPGVPVPVPDTLAPFSASVDWQGDVSEFWAFVPAPDHVLSGPATIRGHADGTLNAPSLEGGIVLTGGRYQNIEFGTLLDRIEMTGDFTRTGEIIFDLMATDGVRGTIAAKGSYGVAGGIIDAGIELNQAALIRRDDATAVISGNATAKSEGRDIAVKGDFRTEFAELRLIGGFGGSVVVIDAIPVGETAPRIETPASAGAERRISLDVSLDFPQQVFVRGRGLESEWGGNIRATGFANKPRVVGLIERRRGWLDLLGRQFELATGEVQFTGTTDPFVRVRLQRNANDITGWLDVTGPASDIELEFGSIPALPPDEVLPRLLFGRSKQSLSGIEAAQLAAGVATLLSGKAGAVDIVRGALGVDVLRVEGGDGAGATISTGKYVSDNVFIGAKQNLDTNNTSAIVEIEVFENIELDGEFGSEEAEGSLNWKFDY